MNLDIIRLLAQRVSHRLTETKSALQLSVPRLCDALNLHFREIDAWSNSIQFYGMSQPKAVEKATIALALHTQPRRFRATDSKAALRDEDDLFRHRGHSILLGEPGSGKTTTLKRVTRKLLFRDATANDKSAVFPIVMRLREVVPGQTLHRRIADILGIAYSIVQVEKIVKNPEPGVADVLIKSFETRCGDAKIEDLVPEVLDATSALLVLDGFDELRSEARDSFLQEMEALGRRLRASRILASSRTGDYTTNTDGFRILEICPLTTEQIVAIANQWLEDPDEFLRLLGEGPYQDLADRPLLLTQMLFVFDRYGYLPDQPSSIYKRVVRLLLEEWDAERRIRRPSKYAGFDPERKAEFLSALSYHLTYALRQRRFSENDLTSAYLAVREPFNLPPNEARQVAQEIQTHTGLIVATSEDTYEFSHLSLQEFLCANYLVRAPLPPVLSPFLTAYSAPLAVAVALSSRPGTFLSDIVLRGRNIHAFEHNGLVSFLSRMTAERPFFERSEPLSFALFRLYEYCLTSPSGRLEYELGRFARLSGIDDSIATGLRFYAARPSARSEDRAGAYVRLSRRPGTEQSLPYGVEPPALAAIPKSVLRRVVQSHEVHLYSATNVGNQLNQKQLFNLCKGPDDTHRAGDGEPSGDSR